MKHTNLSALIQLPPSSSSSVNGDDGYQDPHHYQMNFKKINTTSSDLQRPKRKPYRSSHSINLNDETIKSTSSTHNQSQQNNKKHISQSGKKSLKTTYNSGNVNSSQSSNGSNNQYRPENDEATYPMLSNPSADKKNESLNEPK